MIASNKNTSLKQIIKDLSLAEIKLYIVLCTSSQYDKHFVQRNLNPPPTPSPPKLSVTDWIKILLGDL